MLRVAALGEHWLTAATAATSAHRYLTGVILGKHPSRYHWQIVFYLSAAVTAGGLLVWLVWVRLVGRLSLPDVDDDGPRARTPPAYGASDPEAPPA